MVGRPPGRAGAARPRSGVDSALGGMFHRIRVGVVLLDDDRCLASVAKLCCGRYHGSNQA